MEANQQALFDALPELPGSARAWGTVERTGMIIADTLRSADSQGDLRDRLGRSPLISTIAQIVPLATPDLQQAESPSLSALYQLLRVTANVCAYHDENRTLLIKSGLLASVLATLKAYIPNAQSNSILGASITQLQVMKTALGVLINSSYSFKPARDFLIDAGAVSTVLQLYSAIYKPRSWQSVPTNADATEVSKWVLRQGFATWTWQMLADFRDQEQEQESGKRVFSEGDIHHLVKTVSYFTQAKAETPPTPFDLATVNSFYTSDIEALEESLSSTEALVLDSEAARVEIASKDASLQALADFIEHGVYPQEWKAASESDRTGWKKTFDVCKGASIRILVQVAGEDRNLETLWNGVNADPSLEPKSWFALKMFEWIQANADFVVEQKVDTRGLVVTATLCLGNLARRDSRAIQLAKSPTDALPFILKLLHPEVDIRVKNGALGFLKTLCQPQANRQKLGDEGVLESLANSNIWDRTYDMAEVVQASAIGATKHLCHGNVRNCVRATTSTPQAPSCLSQILQLVSRSDTVAIKSEGTRVLGNIVRALCTAPKAAHTPSYHGAVSYVCEPEQCLLLARLLGRSQKYTVLLNEGIVSLTLIALQVGGDKPVADALVVPLEDETPRGSGAAQSSASSPTDHPRSALGVVASIITSKGSKFPPELRTNACSLVTALFRDTSAKSDTTNQTLGVIKDALQGLLQQVASDEESLSQGERALKEAAQRAVSLM